MAILRSEILIPFLCSAVVAIFSLVFYGLLANEYPSSTLANLIAITAVAAVIQIAFIPQAWIYVFSGHDSEERARRLTVGSLLEWGGTFAGLFIVVSIAIFWEFGQSLVGAYAAFALMGFTSTQGYLRGDKCWIAYATCVTFPSLGRVILFIFTPFLGLPRPISLQQIIILYLLLPEVVRYVFFASTTVAPKWKWTSPNYTRIVMGRIYDNWFYDLGSAIADVGDKYILSLLVSPPLLVVYFFARKLSAAATIIIEPFYAHQFKLGNTSHGAKISQKASLVTLLSGYGIAIIMSVLLLLLLLVVRQTAFLGIQAVPTLILENLFIFVTCLLIDACIAANRWGRYVSFTDGRAQTYLLFRILTFGIFISIVIGLRVTSETNALIIGFVTFYLLDLSYLLKHIGRKRESNCLWRELRNASS